MKRLEGNPTPAVGEARAACEVVCLAQLAISSLDFHEYVDIHADLAS